MAISLLVLLPSDLLWFLFDGFSALLCPIISIVCVGGCFSQIQVLCSLHLAVLSGPTVIVLPGLMY